MSLPCRYLPYIIPFMYVQKWYEDAIKKGTRAAKLVEQIDKHTVGLLKERKSSSYNAWDQLAMAIVVDPDVVTRSEEVYAFIELHGLFTRGQMVVDWNDKQKKYQDIALTAFTAV